MDSGKDPDPAPAPGTRPARPEKAPGHAETARGQAGPGAAAPEETAAGAAAPGDSAPGGASAARNRYLALAAMLFAVSMTFIDMSIVSIAAPDLAKDLGLSSSGVQWVVNAYLLALAAAFALGGRLADVAGHHRMAVIGIWVFAVSSVLCGLVPTGSAALTWMVVFRATQGLGAAIMFPAALAAVVASFPVAERGRALAVFFGVSGALTAIGPILGGWLTTWTWRAIFWVNVPVAVVALVLTHFARVRSSPRREPVDRWGAVLVAAGMALSVLGLQQSLVWGWDSAATWGCIVGGLVLLGVFVVFEARQAMPLIKVRVFADRAFAVDNAALFFAMTAFVPMFFFASVYAQVALGYSPGEAGLYLLVFFAGFAVASQLGGRIVDRRGARPAMIAGTALGATGFALWAGKATDLSLGAQWWWIAPAGAGIGLLLGPASTDAVNRSIDASYGEVTGITQTLRNYASALGLAAAGTILAHVTRWRVTDTLEGAGMPPEQARDTAGDVSEAITGEGGSGEGDTFGDLSPQLVDAIREDYAGGFQVVLYVMALAVAIAFVVSLFHPGTRVTGEDTST